MVGAESLERRRLTVDAGRALVFPAREHETHGAQAPGQFLRGINSRDRMRMQPRRARRGRHEHHDRPHKAVKHTPYRARPMPWPDLDNWPISADSRAVPITTSEYRIQIWSDGY